MTMADGNILIVGGGQQVSCYTFKVLKAPERRTQAECKLHAACPHLSMAVHCCTLITVHCAVSLTVSMLKLAPGNVWPPRQSYTCT